MSDAFWIEFAKIFGSIVAGGGLSYLVGGRAKIASDRAKLAKDRVISTDELADQYVDTVNELLTQIREGNRQLLELEHKINQLSKENMILKQKVEDNG